MRSVGDCSLEEPGDPARHGLADFIETPLTIHGSGSEDALALTIVCVIVDDAVTEELVIVLPVLAALPSAGEFRVVDPDGPEPEVLRYGELAFATLTRTAGVPVTMAARAGSVVISRSGGVVTGAYQLALTPESVDRRGRRVVGGAFRAPADE